MVCNGGEKIKSFFLDKITATRTPLLHTTNALPAATTNETTDDRKKIDCGTERLDSTKRFPKSHQAENVYF